MAIKDFYPAIRPTLDLNFAGSRTADPRITFTRASTATYFDEFGVMRTAPANAPRIDFDPVTGECKGLLIEEQRTNLLTYSEQFDNATWNKAYTSITANSAVAPDGLTTADSLIEDSLNNFHSVSKTSIAITANTAYTFSIYAKYSGSRRYVAIALRNSGLANGGYAYFDLLDSTYTATGFTGSGSSITSSVTDVGNGWLRLAISCVVDNSSTSAAVTVITEDTKGTFTGYPGDGTSGIYIWGAQLEQGAFPTSYIPTTSAQVTRAADAASITGTNFSKWYKQEEGTFLVDYRRNSNKASGNQIPFVVSDGAGNNVIAITDSANGSSDRFLVAVGGVNQASLGSVDYTENQRMIRSIGYKKDDVSTSVNGSSAASDDIVLIPSVNRLDIGYASYFSASRINGYISHLSYYPKRLSNTNLQALTA